MTATALAVLTTDGRRDCIRATIDSAEAMLAGPVTDRMIFTDSDPEYTTWLHGEFPDWWVRSTGDRRGYAHAMHQAFNLLADSEPDTVFWCEDDFTFNRPVDLAVMAEVMDRNPRLAQLVLRRQPWNPAEAAAGGIVEQHPDWYDERRDDQLGVAWLEHTGFWSNNPCLIPRWVLDLGYPTGDHAEGMFGIAVRDRRPGARFAFWGARDSGEACRHIGDVGVRGAF